MIATTAYVKQSAPAWQTSWYTAVVDFYSCVLSVLCQHFLRNPTQLFAQDAVLPAVSLLIRWLMEDQLNGTPASKTASSASNGHDLADLSVAPAVSVSGLVLSDVVSERLVSLYSCASLQVTLRSLCAHTSSLGLSTPAAAAYIVTVTVPAATLASPQTPTGTASATAASADQPSGTPASAKPTTAVVTPSSCRLRAVATAHQLCPSTATSAPQRLLREEVDFRGFALFPTFCQPSVLHTVRQLTALDYCTPSPACPPLTRARLTVCHLCLVGLLSPQQPASVRVFVALCILYSRNFLIFIHPFFE